MRRYWGINVFVILMVTLTLVGCHTEDKHSLNQERYEEDPGHVLDEVDQGFPQLDLIRRAQATPTYLEMAEQNLNDELVFSHNWDPYPIQGTPDWDADPYQDGSWQFYLHSLEHVGYMAVAYEETGNEAYLSKGMEHIVSWMEVNGDRQQATNSYAWHDHGTANRVQNIMHWWVNWRDSSLYDVELDKLIVAMLYEHGLFLADDEHYSPYNHGVFQDQALLHLAVYFDDIDEAEQWREKAMERLQIRLEEDVTPEGVHREHSPNYHLLMMNRFQEIAAFCHYHGLPLPETIKERLVKMDDYLARITLPNGTLPLIGDTRTKKIFGRYENQAVSTLLQYVQSRGRKGSPPADKDAVFPEGGVALFREGWDFGADDLYLMFTAAFHSTVHKHGDDLAFILTKGETDFLVDGGMYSYREDDPMRAYLRGTLGHNTIAVDHEPYSLGASQAGRSKIIDYGLHETYSYVSAEHTLYEGVTITRTLMFVRPGTIIIHDRMQADSPRSYTQIFHAGPDVEVKEAGAKKVVLQEKEGAETLEIRQMAAVEGMAHYRGEENPPRGWQSQELGQAEPIDTFHFHQSGGQAEYLTLIMFSDSNAEEVRVEDGEVILTTSDGETVVYPLEATAV